MGTQPPIPRTRRGIKPPIVQRLGEFHAQIQIPTPLRQIRTLPREAVYAGQEALVSEVRVSFAMPTKDGRNNSPSLDGGWGVRPTEEAPGSARARKAPTPSGQRGGPGIPLYDFNMGSVKVPAKKRPIRKNLVAIDGTMDKIDKLRVFVEEIGRDAELFELRIVHKESVREHVDCSNPACFNGGISLGDVLREMVAGRQEDFIGTCFCTGQEGDPEEPGPHPSCATRFEIEATLHYR